MADMDLNELRRLAQIGAKARLQELDQERAALLRSFPGLRRFASQSEPAADTATAKAAGAAPRKRRQPRMSAAARKAVSVRMKKYWAQRRAEKRASKR